MNPAFTHFIGIDYSGAKTPTDPLKGLQVFQAAGELPPKKMRPPSSVNTPRNSWSRKEIAECLVELVNSGTRFIAGIYHCFSFPISYFNRYGLNSWDDFLVDFRHHWPTHIDNTYFSFITDEAGGYENMPRIGSSDEFRITEKRTTSAKSVFQFGVQGQVAQSSHTGIPWLLYIREQAGDKVHFWLFDGWDIPEGKSVIAEVYPSLLRRRVENKYGLTGDELDAYVVAAWLSGICRDGLLGGYLHPPLTDRERGIVGKEGWILGVC